MSETTTEAKPAESADLGEGDQQEQQEVAPEREEKDDKGAKEAQKYRKRAQDAEAARDSLSDRVTRLQRSLVEMRAAAVLEVPGDLWTVGGQDLSDFVDKNGELLDDVVAEKLQDLVRARPQLRRVAGPKPDPHQGRSGGKADGVPANWQGLLRGRT